jgi:signal transduction histidine kinase
MNESVGMGNVRPKILAIDDTPTNLMVLAGALSKDYAFQLACSGAAGLAMAEVAPPDLILLDVMMPEMDGHETCRRFKAMPALADIPIIFVTALTDCVSELIGLELGAVDYLHKPINIDIAQQRIRNLLEREALRREVEQHRHQLERLVATRTVELTDARDAAEVANLAKSTFLANMSHELRTPLGIMLGFNNLLQLKATDPSLKDKYLKIATAGTELLAMIEDILQVSKMEADRAAAGCQIFSPKALLSLVEARFSAKAQAKGLALVQEIDPQLPKKLSGSPARIKQVLNYLMSNAIKFSDHGRITLRMVMAQQTGLGVTVRLEVQDQGIGIAPHHFGKLFQSFSQVDDSMTRRHAGMGIGLALCKHLAETMGGSIGVDSEPDQGSRFWVSLTLQPSEEAAPAPHWGDKAQTFLPELSQTLTAPVDFWAVVKKLNALLTTGDVEALYLWEASKELISPYLGAWLQKFSESLHDFEFEKAQETLQAALGPQLTMEINS